MKSTESGTAATQKYGALNERADQYSLYHKVPASFNDPMSVYFVLDALVNSARGTYLRPTYIVAFLRVHIGQFYWSNGVVGRIMAGLNGVCREVYLKEEGNAYIIDSHGRQRDGSEPEIEEDEREHHLPFAQGRDSKGRYYVIDPQGGNEGLLWLLQCRKLFLREARQSMKDDDTGRFRENWGGELGPTEYYYQQIDGPARTAVAFRNQLQGDVNFTQPTAEARKMKFDATQ